jgi:hypothetical protein
MNPNVSDQQQKDQGKVNFSALMSGRRTVIGR